MDSTTLLIIISVLLTDIIVVTFILRKKRGQRQRARALLTGAAESEGWRSVPAIDAGRVYHFEGTIAPGISWELIGQQSGNGRSKGQHTTWRTSDVQLKENVVAVGPGTRLATSDVDLGHSIIQLSLRRIFGEEAAPELADLKIIDTADDNFSDDYMLLSSDEALARQFIRDPVPSILLDWKSEEMPVPGLLIGSKGMQVRFGKMIDDAAIIKKIVMLCGALAVRGKEIAREERIVREEEWG